MIINWKEVKRYFLVDTYGKSHIPVHEILSLILTHTMQFLWSLSCSLRPPNAQGPTALLTKLGINPMFSSWHVSRMQTKPLVQILEMTVRLDGEAGLANGSCLVSEYSGFINLPHPFISKADDWIRSSFGSGLVRLCQSRSCSCWVSKA